MLPNGNCRDSQEGGNATTQTSEEVTRFFRRGLVMIWLAATLPIFVHIRNLRGAKEMREKPNTANTVFCVEVSRSGHFIPEEVRLFHRKIL